MALVAGDAMVIHAYFAVVIQAGFVVPAVAFDACAVHANMVRTVIRDAEEVFGHVRAGKAAVVRAADQAVGAGGFALLAAQLTKPFLAYLSRVTVGCLAGGVAGTFAAAMVGAADPILSADVAGFVGLAAVGAEVQRQRLVELANLVDIDVGNYALLVRGAFAIMVVGPADAPQAVVSPRCATRGAQAGPIFLLTDHVRIARSPGAFIVVLAASPSAVGAANLAFRAVRAFDGAVSAWLAALGAAPRWAGEGLLADHVVVAAGVHALDVVEAVAPAVTLSADLAGKAGPPSLSADAHYAEPAPGHAGVALADMQLGESLFAGVVVLGHGAAETGAWFAPVIERADLVRILAGAAALIVADARDAKAILAKVLWAVSRDASTIGILQRGAGDATVIGAADELRGVAVRLVMAVRDEADASNAQIVIRILLLAEQIVGRFGAGDTLVAFADLTVGTGDLFYAAAIAGQAFPALGADVSLAQCLLAVGVVQAGAAGVVLAADRSVLGAVLVARAVALDAQTLDAEVAGAKNRRLDAAHGVRAGRAVVKVAALVFGEAADHRPQPAVRVLGAGVAQAQPLGGAVVICVSVLRFAVRFQLALDAGGLHA